MKRLGKRQRLLLRWGVPFTLLSVALGVAVVKGAARVDPTAPGADGSIDGLTRVLDREAAPEMRRITFEDVTAESGVVFRHFPATRRSLLPEDMGSGLAFGDVDDDGDHDLFLVNFRGSLIDDDDEVEESAAGDGSGDGRCALYSNRGDGRFDDVSAASGADLHLYGMGAAFADADGDGDLDLYVTAYGPNVLLENDGHGVFADVTARAGVGDERFGAGCAWADDDLDGDLDLYVANYVRFSYRDEDRAQITRQYGSEIPYTINPSSYPAEANALYRNDGSGRFQDVAAAAGVADPEGRSLGAIWFDFDGDGRLDLYVANDVSANGVFQSRGDGTFKDVGAESLAADYRGAMGLATCDLGGDGDLDLFVTHWIAQENALFENVRVEKPGEGARSWFFADLSESYGLGQISLDTVGWSAGFADFDSDGASDLWVVNGSTLERKGDRTRLVPQPPHLFRQEVGAGFYELARHASPRLAAPIVGRGGAACDFDGDGRVDLAIAVHGGAPLLLRNTSATEHHWLGVRLRQGDGNSRALGATVTVRVGDRRQSAMVGADGAYLSQHPTDLHFGLGAATRVDELIVRWPDGELERRTDVAVDRILDVVRGG